MTHPIGALALLLATVQLAPAGVAAADPPAFNAPWQAFDTDLRNVDVALGDLDEDGRLDIVTANAGLSPVTASSVTIRFGTGDGVFETGHDFALPFGGPSALALADINQDTHLDLLTVMPNSQSVEYRFGDGHGGFGGVHSLATSAFTPSGVGVADFNEDGRMDLAIRGGSRLIVRLGTGSGSFGGPVLYSLGGSISLTAMEVTDANADGHADIVLVASSAASRFLWCQLGDGHAGFTTQLSSVPVASTSVHLAEMTGDGLPDALLAGPVATAVYLARGLGAGLFQAPSSLAVASGTKLALPLDCDGDGDFDIVTGLEFLRAHGDGTFDPPVSLHVPSAVAIAAGPLNGDALRDLVVSNGFSSVYVLAGAAQGFPGPWNPGSLADGVSWAGGGTLTDLNADGILDLVVGTTVSFPSPSAIETHLGLGDGNFGPGQTTAVPGYQSGIITGDFDEDSIPDVVFGSPLGFLKGLGDGTFAPPPGSWPDAGWPAATADFNRDGHLDILFGDFTELVIYPGLGDGHFAAAGAELHLPSGNDSWRVAVGDLNHDGAPDIVSSAGYPPGIGPPGAGQQLSLWLNNGAGGFGARRLLVEGHPLRSVALGDFNEDGHLDVASTYQADGNNLVPERLVVFDNDGSGSFAPARPFPLGASARELVVADLNGDGHLDVASAAFYSNAISVLVGDGNGNFAARRDRGTGLAPAGLMVGRMNGDLAPDLLVLLNGADPATPGDPTPRTKWYLPLLQPTPSSAVAEPAPGGPAEPRAFPNPMRGETIIRFSLPAPTRARLEIYDLAGRRVARLLDAEQPAGPRAVRWEGRDDAGRPVAPGVYFYRLMAGGWRRSNRLVRLR